MRTSPPWRSTYARAGSAYIRLSGRIGRTTAAADGSGPNISASTRTNGVAAASSGAWFSAATASGSHSHSTSFGPWRCRRSQSETVSLDSEDAIVPVRASDRLAARSGAARCSAERRSRQGSASQSSTAASRCSGAGSGGQRRTDRRPRWS